MPATYSTVQYVQLLSEKRWSQSFALAFITHAFRSVVLYFILELYKFITL